MGALSGLYRPKHLEERLRRHHVRQMLQQMEELGILSTPAAYRTPKPKLETLESGVEFDSCAPAHPPTDHSHETSSFLGANPRRNDPTHQHRRRVPGGSQSANATLMEAHTSDLSSVTLCLSGNSDTLLVTSHSDGDRGGNEDASGAAVRALELCDDDEAIGNTLHTRPDSEPNLSVHTTNAVDSDIHKHGVGAIDNASKYLQKHLFNVDAGGSAHEFGARTSPRAPQRLISPRALPNAATTKSPRPAGSASTPLPLGVARHNIGEPLKSASACPSPSPDNCVQNEIDNVIFPTRSKSEGVDAFSILPDSSSNQLLSSQPSSTLPPLVRPLSSRPSSATSTGGEGVFPAAHLSVRSSPHISPRAVGTAHCTDEPTQDVNGGMKIEAGVEKVVESSVETEFATCDDAVATM